MACRHSLSDSQADLSSNDVLLCALTAPSARQPCCTRALPCSSNECCCASRQHRSPGAAHWRRPLDITRRSHASVSVSSRSSCTPLSAHTVSAAVRVGVPSLAPRSPQSQQQKKKPQQFSQPQKLPPKRPQDPQSRLPPTAAPLPAEALAATVAPVLVPIDRS
jgi:hypothetical protein